MIERKLIVSVDVDSWEKCYIQLTDEGYNKAPQEITEEWLLDNTSLWEWGDQIEVMSSVMKNIKIIGEDS